MKCWMKFKLNEFDSVAIDTNFANGNDCFLFFDHEYNCFCYIYEDYADNVILFDSNNNIRKIVKACLALDNTKFRIETV